MSIFRSTNPLDWNQVDGIVIAEQAPPPSVQGVGTGTVILAAQFARGLVTLNDTFGIQDIYQQYGKELSGGLSAISNKRFSKLRIVRVDATGAVLATRSFLATATPIIQFFAKQGKGAYGNGIQIKVEAGSTSGKKYTVKDTSLSAVWPQEVYDNIAVAAVTSATFAGSNLITATVLATSSEPDNIAFTSLASGADGTAVDGDYTAAIDKCAIEGAGNVLILDAYNSTRNAYLVAHVAATQDKMVILAGPQVQVTSAVLTDVANYRDTDGRIVYSYPWVQTVINGAAVYQPAASWYASILSQTAPNVDPASADNISICAGITGLYYQLARADYIALMAAGVSAFEFDLDLSGYKIKSGVVTQIVNSSKLMVFRRRMADYLTVSAGKFLKLYQNGPNAFKKRTAVKAAILGFIKQNEDVEILPKDSEVKNGKAKLVDTEVLNTDASIAAGYFKILWRQRIFSSMRFVVLQAEIGESVVVTEVG